MCRVEYSSIISYHKISINYRVIMITPSQLDFKTHTNLGCAAGLATLDKLVDKFTLPPAALAIGDASLTHVKKLAAHSTKPPTPTTMVYNHL
jgi:hypothetical protein